MACLRHPTLVVDGSLFWRPGATPQCAPHTCALAVEADGDGLDAHKADELEGNEIRLEDETIGNFAICRLKRLTHEVRVNLERARPSILSGSAPCRARADPR